MFFGSEHSEPTTGGQSRTAGPRPQHSVAKKNGSTLQLQKVVPMYNYICWVKLLNDYFWVTWITAQQNGHLHRKQNFKWHKTGLRDLFLAAIFELAQKSCTPASLGSTFDKEFNHELIVQL